MEQALTKNRSSVKVEKQQKLFLWLYYFCEHQKVSWKLSLETSDPCLAVILCTGMVEKCHGTAGTALHKIIGQSPTWSGSPEVGETFTTLYNWIAALSGVEEVSHSSEDQESIWESENVGRFSCMKPSSALRWEWMRNEIWCEQRYTMTPYSCLTNPHSIKI